MSQVTQSHTMTYIPPLELHSINATFLVKLLQFHWVNYQMVT